MFVHFQSNEVLAPLAPLNQVSQLLQSRKSEQDVQTICDLCTSLSTAQVLKVMKSYKLDDYESEITNVFLMKLTQELNARQTVNVYILVIYFNSILTLLIPLAAKEQWRRIHHRPEVHPALQGGLPVQRNQAGGHRFAVASESGRISHQDLGYSCLLFYHKSITIVEN